MIFNHQEIHEKIKMIKPLAQMPQRLHNISIDMTHLTLKDIAL